MKEVIKNIKKENKLLYVAGASASGKSYFAENLKSELEKQGKKVLLVSADMYYVNNTKLKHLIYGTFDHPNLIKHDELEKAIKKYLTSHTIDIPEYSFVESRRTGSNTFKGKVDHVIIEGLYTIELLKRPKDSLSFFVDSSAEELIIRRLIRDQLRTGDRPEQIIIDISRVFPMRNIYGAKQRKKANFTITNEYEILEKDGIESVYKKTATKDITGKLIQKEYFVDFEYNDSQDKNGVIVVSESYKKKGGDLEYVIITKRKQHITPDTEEFKTMSIKISSLGAITNIHALFQLAGLKLKRTIKKTLSFYEEKNGDISTIKTRKGKKYKKIS